jgi:hypothetical protein
MKEIGDTGKQEATNQTIIEKKVPKEQQPLGRQTSRFPDQKVHTITLPNPQKITGRNPSSKLLKRKSEIKIQMPTLVEELYKQSIKKKIEKEKPEDNVERSLLFLEKGGKILPGTHFGRKLSDTNRTIYNKTEAPDIIYPNVIEQWKNINSRDQAKDILFSRQADKHDPYYYMPKPCEEDNYLPNSDLMINKENVPSLDRMPPRRIFQDTPIEFTRKFVTDRFSFQG